MSNPANAISLNEFCSKIDTNEYLRLGKELSSENVGKSFSLLSFGLSLDSSKQEELYNLYMKVVECWSGKLIESSRYEDVLKIFEVAHDIYPHSADLNYLLACTLHRHCLGSKGPQYCDEVWPLLVAVDQGIKPSLLWDVCTPDTNALLSLLDIAFEKKLLTERLRVVEVDLDVFIVNMSALVRMLTNILTSEESWLVDISESEPKIPSKDTHIIFRNHIISLLSQLGISDQKLNSDPKSDANEHIQISDNMTASSCHHSPGASRPQAESNLPTPSKAITVHFPNEVNLSTVFGCMLGYPQIYWWQGDKGGNSLSGVPLKIFKFGAAFMPNSSYIELFSFSIPESLETELRPGIERWGNILNVWVEKSMPFSESKFTCDPVLCLSVAL